MEQEDRKEPGWRNSEACTAMQPVSGSSVVEVKPPLLLIKVFQGQLHAGRGSPGPEG